MAADGLLRKSANLYLLPLSIWIQGIQRYTG